MTGSTRSRAVRAGFVLLILASVCGAVPLPERPLAVTDSVQRETRRQLVLVEQRLDSLHHEVDVEAARERDRRDISGLIIDGTGVLVGLATAAIALLVYIFGYLPKQSRNTFSQIGKDAESAEIARWKRSEKAIEDLTARSERASSLQAARRESALGLVDEAVDSLFDEVERTLADGVADIPRARLRLHACMNILSSTPRLVRGGLQHFSVLDNRRRVRLFTAVRDYWLAEAESPDTTRAEDAQGVLEALDETLENLRERRDEEST
jgi:hypothetical protein